MLLEAFINGGGAGIRKTPVALYTVLSRGFTAFYHWTEQTPLLDTQSELFIGFLADFQFNNLRALE